MDYLKYKLGNLFYKIDRKLEKRYDKINEKYLEALDASDDSKADKLLSRADRVRTWGTGSFEIFTKASAFSEVVADEYDWQTPEERTLLVRSLYGLELFRLILVCYFRQFQTWLDRPLSF
jgi:hypothetical protein